MKVVVFGGAGFLGSHVADALTLRGYEVRIFDLAPAVDASPGQEVIVGDILDEEAVRKAIDGCSVVYHFAGLADLDAASVRPVDTVRANILGTTYILDAAVRAGVKRIMYASTVYVFSDLGGFYRCSKQACESYVEEYQRKFGLEYTILRYGSLYGPRTDERNSLHRYLKQGLLNGHIECSGAAEDVREYVHVRDAARMSVEALDDAYLRRHLLISGHHAMRVADVLKMIQEMLHQRVTVRYADAPNQAHYTITPYSFSPKAGDKLVGNCYVDMGQGLLECLQEIHAKTRRDP